MKIDLPQGIKKAIKKGFIISVIHFGSSLRRHQFQDIDLAVIIKRNSYKKFLETVYGEKFNGFDISLIKEEEIQGPEKFRFGGHGAHFLYSLIKGKTLYGKNPFLKFRNLKFEKQIKRSIISRLYDYIEDVRRAVFRGKINKNIRRRWAKFLRLSLYLLDNNLTYPEVLSLDKNKVNKCLRKHNIDIDTTSKNLKNPQKLLISYETVWERVLKKEEAENLL